MEFNDLSEAIDASEFEGGLHPSKRSRIEDTTHDVEQLFPNLGPDAERYLEHITSESYKTTIRRMARYLEVDLTDLGQELPDMNSLSILTGRTVMQLDNLERHIRPQLQELAIKTVLNQDLPEFEMIRDMYDKGLIKFDITITGMEGMGEIAEMMFGDDEPETEDGLAPSEDMALNSDRFDGDEDLRREFANFMMAGNALNKMYLFHMVEEELNRLNPGLVPRYGIAAAAGNLGYYAYPDVNFQEMPQPLPPAGVEKIDTDENTIYAKGINFVVVVHELVKGIWEYLSADTGSERKLRGETPDDEVLPMMAGPAMYQQFQAMIPRDKLYLLPLIYKIILDTPEISVKEILKGMKSATASSKSKVILNKVIEDAEDQYSQIS